MLHLCGQKFDYVHVDLPSGAQKSKEFLSRNQFGQVPMLVDKLNKRIVVQSGAILEYLADTLGQFKGDHDKEKLLARMWCYWENDVMERGILRLRGYRMGYITAPDDVIAHYEAEGTQALGDLETFLEKRKWLCGGKKATFADIYVFGSIILAHDAGYDLSPYKHITRWAHRVAGLKHFGTPDHVLPQEAKREHAKQPKPEKSRKK
jgi:glutathione S-transferase